MAELFATYTCVSSERQNKRAMQRDTYCPFTIGPNKRYPTVFEPLQISKAYLEVLKECQTKDALPPLGELHETSCSPDSPGNVEEVGLCDSSAGKQNKLDTGLKGRKLTILTRQDSAWWGFDDKKDDAEHFSKLFPSPLRIQDLALPEPSQVEFYPSPAKEEVQRLTSVLREARTALADAGVREGKLMAELIDAKAEIQESRQDLEKVKEKLAICTELLGERIERINELELEILDAREFHREHCSALFQRFGITEEQL
eukprot:jgi/Botrbrau1/17247/Bobra.0015s0006.1